MMVFRYGNRSLAIWIREWLGVTTLEILSALFCVRHIPLSTVTSRETESNAHTRCILPLVDCKLVLDGLYT